MVYRAYITDAIKIITENTAKLSVNGGSYVQKRYIDAIKPVKQDNRTGDEIAKEIAEKAGIKVIKHGKPA